MAWFHLAAFNKPFLIEDAIQFGDGYSVLENYLWSSPYIVSGRLDMAGALSFVLAMTFAWANVSVGQFAEPGSLWAGSKLGHETNFPQLEALSKDFQRTLIQASSLEGEGEEPVPSNPSTAAKALSSSNLPSEETTKLVLYCLDLFYMT